MVKHANGRDWWLITSLCNSNLFYFYLINHENITLINKVKEGPEINGWSWVYLNRVSPDGELLAKIDQCGFVSIYRLDRCEGKITYLYTVYVPIQIDNCDPLETFNCSSGACISGIEFSPDSRILYVSRGYEQLFQLDLTSRRLLKIYNRIGTNFLQFSQRLNDGSIYVDNPFYNASNLHVLRRPDLKGLACDFDIGAVDMPADVQFRLQQNPDIYMGSVKGTVCDSL